MVLIRVYGNDGVALWDTRENTVKKGHAWGYDAVLDLSVRNVVEIGVPTFEFTEGSYRVPITQQAVDYFAKTTMSVLVAGCRHPRHAQYRVAKRLRETGQFISPAPVVSIVDLDEQRDTSPTGQVRNIYLLRNLPGFNFAFSMDSPVSGEFATMSSTDGAQTHEEALQKFKDFYHAYNIIDFRGKVSVDKPVTNSHLKQLRDELLFVAYTQYKDQVDLISEKFDALIEGKA